MELAEARALVREKTDKDITVRHLISVEGVMSALARRPGEDDRWRAYGQARRGEQESVRPGVRFPFRTHSSLSGASKLR
jgi:hypothetical protein